MKKLIFLLFALGPICFLFSCNRDVIPTTTNSSEVTNVIPKNELIAFTENYVSSKGTNIKFSNENMFDLDFRNSADIEITSSLFSENAKIVNGKAYIINADLDKLKTIPALSKCKVIGAENIVRDSYGVKYISLLYINEEKDIKYLFRYSRQSDNTFLISESEAGIVSYNGKQYKAFAKSKAIAKYSLIEGSPPGM